MRLVTLNVRNPSFGDGENGWPHRRELFYEALRQLKPTVLCLQETIADHAEEVRKTFGYASLIGTPREVEGTGEMCAILTSAPEIAGSGTEWLSETPSVAGSKSWGAACTRVVTWADFGDWVLFNTHLDHVSLEARTNGMAQILRRADEFGKPCLLVGDFNAVPEETTVQFARKAGFADLADGTGTTYHNYGHGPASRIDYILARGPWACRAAGIKRGRFSDHNAVYADLVMGSSR